MLRGLFASMRNAHQTVRTNAHVARKFLLLLRATGGKMGPEANEEE